MDIMEWGDISSHEWISMICHCLPWDDLIIISQLQTSGKRIELRGPVSTSISKRSSAQERPKDCACAHV